MKFFATKKKPVEDVDSRAAGSLSTVPLEPAGGSPATPVAGGGVTGSAPADPGADRARRILRAINASSGPDDPGSDHPGSDHPGSDHPGTDHPGTVHRAGAAIPAGGAATIPFPAREENGRQDSPYGDGSAGRLSQAAAPVQRTATQQAAVQQATAQYPSVVQQRPASGADIQARDDIRALGNVRAAESAAALLGPTAVRQLGGDGTAPCRDAPDHPAHDRPAHDRPAPDHPVPNDADGLPTAAQTAAQTAAHSGRPARMPRPRSSVVLHKNVARGPLAPAQGGGETVANLAAVGLPANDRSMQPDPGAPDSGAPDSGAPNAGVSDSGAPNADAPNAGTRAAAPPQGPAPIRPAPPAKPAREAGWTPQETPRGNDDPLLDCLVIMTAIFERPHSSDALSAGLPLIDDRLTPELFVRAAGRAGLSARIVRRNLADITNLSLPAVLLLESGKACVLIKHDAGNTAGGTASVVLPETGQGVTQISSAKLASMYTGYVIFAKPEFQFDQRSEATEIRPTKDWFWGTLKKFWRIYAQVGVAALFVNLFAIATPLFVMNVYDRVVPTKGHETLWVLVVGVSVIFAFEFALRWLRSYFTDTAGRSADVIMASMIFQQILGVKMSAKPASAGAFANQLREFETLRDFFTSATMVTLIDLPFIFLFITLIFIIGGPVALVPLAAVPVVIGAGLVIQKPLTKIVTESARESAQKHALLVESIVGLETIKSMGAEGRTQRTWERFVGETSKSGMKARSLSQLAMFITTLTTQFTTIAVVVVGVYLIFGGDLTVGGLIACTILTGRAMAPLGQVAALMTRFNQSMVSLKTLDQLMQMPVERPAGSQFVHRPNLKGSIEFRNVTFAYPNQQINALENVSFNVNPGEKIGVIGKIGSGKSTIERLALGLYQPDSGSIRIDGTDIQQLDPADLRRNIGYVSQDIFLFYGSVRENIAVGAPHADDAAILRAAHLSGVDNFVSKHPQGFDLNVGERGENLSGGQRQSISLARAFVRNPNVLILDEPTSAMDKGSEDWFIARLREYMANRTVIVVTQRVSMLTLVDRLLVMDGGRVVADGPRDTVLEMLARGQIKGTGE